MAEMSKDVTVGRQARRILCLLRRRGPMSRAQIGWQLDLPASAVSTACKQLMDNGVLARCGSERSDSGRSIARIGFAENFMPSVGIEVSRNGTRLVAVGAAGNLLECRSLSSTPVERGHLADTILSTCSCVKDLECDVKAVGVAVGGPVDLAGRMWVDHAGGGGAEGAALGPAIEQRLAAPTRLINDVHAACLAEARLGAGTGRPAVLYVHTGMGIRLALTVNGNVYAGAHGLAGELGHTKSSGEILCYCGNHGCLETVAALPALIGKLEALEKRSGSPDNGFEPADLLGMANNGYKAAVSTLRRAAQQIGQAVADAAALFDPDVIVLGGILVRKVEDFRTELVETILDRLLPLMRRGTNVVEGSLGEEAPAIGAAILAQDMLMKRMGLLPNEETSFC